MTESVYEKEALTEVGGSRLRCSRGDQIRINILFVLSVIYKDRGINLWSNL